MRYMGPMIIAAGWKVLGQTVFVIGGIICFALHEREAGMLLLGMAGGSLVPVAEKAEASRRSPSR